MSETQTPRDDSAHDAPDASGAPDADTVGAQEADQQDVGVRDVVDRSTVRRAPRYGAFFVTGALVGTVVGLSLALYLVNSPAGSGMFKSGVYVTVLTAFVTTVTTLLAGLFAVIADKRSLRGR